MFQSSYRKLKKKKNNSVLKFYQNKYCKQEDMEAQLRTLVLASGICIREIANIIITLLPI